LDEAGVRGFGCVVSRVERDVSRAEVVVEAAGGNIADEILNAGAGA